MTVEVEQSASNNEHKIAWQLFSRPLPAHAFNFQRALSDFLTPRGKSRGNFAPFRIGIEKNSLNQEKKMRELTDDETGPSQSVAGAVFADEPLTNSARALTLCTATCSSSLAATSLFSTFFLVAPKNVVGSARSPSKVQTEGTEEKSERKRKQLVTGGRKKDP